MRVPWLLVPLSVVAVSAAAQASATSPDESVEKPAFEVASVRPNTSGPNSMSFGGPPGRFDARNLTLEMLITQAYGIRREQLDGALDWIAEERFDMTARAPDGAPADQRDLMLQALLEDRFRLVTHRETRESDVELEFTREPALATTEPDAAAVPLDEAPTIFTAVEEQLGLKLQAERGPVEFLVVDSVERPDPD